MAKKRDAKSGPPTAPPHRNVDDPLSAWLLGKSPVAVVPLDIMVIEMGSYHAPGVKKPLGVMSYDRFGVLPVAFELDNPQDVYALLVGLTRGFSWCELHRDPVRRCDLRCEAALERALDDANYTNKGKAFCQYSKAHGWQEVEDEDALGDSPDIEESMGTFITLTQGTFVFPHEIQFLVGKKRHVESLQSMSGTADAALARQLGQRIAAIVGQPIPTRVPKLDQAIEAAHLMPLDVEHPKGL